MAPRAATTAYAVVGILALLILVTFIKDAVNSTGRGFTPPRALVVFRSLLSEAAAGALRDRVSSSHYRASGEWVLLDTRPRPFHLGALYDRVVYECVRRFHILSLHAGSARFLEGSHDGCAGARPHRHPDDAYVVWVALAQATLRVGAPGAEGTTYYALPPGAVVVFSTDRTHSTLGVSSDMLLEFGLRLTPHGVAVRESKETRRRWEARWSRQRSSRIRVMRPEWVE